MRYLDPIGLSLTPCADVETCFLGIVGIGCCRFQKKGFLKRMKRLGPLFIQAAGHRPGRRIPGATAGALAARLAILAVPSSDPIMAGAFRASGVKFLL